MSTNHLRALSAALAVGVTLLIVTLFSLLNSTTDALASTEQALDKATSAPIPTVVKTVKVKVTLPPKVVTKTVEVRVTERASRSSARGGTINLRNQKLWEKIAACESGGNWSINTGSFDGGLQFLPSTWRSWGGTDFAPYAHQATKAEQITIANRSSKTNDPWLKPWPNCGKKAAAALGIKFP